MTVALTLDIRTPSGDYLPTGALISVRYSQTVRTGDGIVPEPARSPITLTSGIDPVVTVVPNDDPGLSEDSTGFATIVDVRWDQDGQFHTWSQWVLISSASAPAVNLSALPAAQGLPSTPRVNVSGSPTAGQVLTATGNTTASWITPSDLGIFTSVSRFGATGNGTTDDTAAIQAAITAVAGGGTVYLPRGTYKLTAALTLGNGVTLLGDGPTASILEQTSTTADGVTATDLADAGLRSLGLTGPGSGTGNGVHATLTSATQTTGLDFQDVHVSSFGADGINLQMPAHCAFTGLHVEGCGGWGIDLNGSDATSWPTMGTALAIDACSTRSNGTGGLYLYNVISSTISGCSADQEKIGFSVEGDGGAIRFSGCSNDGCQTGVKIAGGYPNTLDDHAIVNNMGVGFWLAGYSSAVLSQFSEIAGDTATNSIQTDDGTNLLIVGDLFTDSALAQSGGFSWVSSDELESSSLTLLADRHLPNVPVAELTNVGTGTTAILHSSAVIQAPSPAAGTNDTTVATTAWVNSTIAATEMRGTGSPVGKVTPASAGIYYTDTAGTLGAWRWVSTGTTNTSWMIERGNTGLRKPSLSSTWVGSMFVIRSGDVVTLQLAGFAAAVSGTGSSTPLITLPVGFRPLSSFASPLNAGNTINIYTNGQITTGYTATTAIYQEWTWITGDTWPTVLP